MPHRRFLDSRKIMEYFKEQDPANDKVDPLLNHLQELERLDERIRVLEAQRQEGGKIEINAALELAECYLRSQRIAEFSGMINSILSQADLPAPVFFRVASLLHNARRFAEMTQALDLCVEKLPADAPPQILLEIARMYAAAGQNERMRDILVRYLDAQPTDWKAWIDLATLQHSLNQIDDAVRSLKQAVAFGSNNAIVLIRESAALAPLLPHVTSRPTGLRTLPGLPGLPPRDPHPRHP